VTWTLLAVLFLSLIIGTLGWLATEYLAGLVTRRIQRRCRPRYLDQEHEDPMAMRPPFHPEPRYRPRTNPDTGLTYLEAEIAESPYTWDRSPWLPSTPPPGALEQVRALLEHEDPER
jgi:hypothetical protein